MGKTGSHDIEDLRGLQLGRQSQTELIEAQTECTVIFNNEDWWPSGVVMSYLWLDDSFWFTAVEGRGHVRGMEKDPRVSFVISNAGTTLPGRRMLSIRGTAIVHRDAETKQRVLSAFAQHHKPDDSENFLRLLDSPKRLVIQVYPTAVAVSHDSTKMAGDGRGGPSKTKH